MPVLDESWRRRLSSEFEREYMSELALFLDREVRAGRQVYPQPDSFFAALQETPFDHVKVVILGQDPYHAAGQAHGLCFSVPPGQTLPPSLRNIYAELASDLGRSAGSNGCLLHWARQGVLLLNSVLSVEAGKAGSHRDKGWERFSDRIIELLNEEREHLVFLLWGSDAQRKGRIIDRARHLVLEAPHPSPLSAYRGFLGCRHFSQCNSYLREHGMTAIDWTGPQNDDNGH